ncbi:MAG: serine hydroxymethyltransferase [Dehalococcoidia bacterium]|nr:serine hydroxymethyltransferase [Dehalococcoidia bacterium]
MATALKLQDPEVYATVVGEEQRLREHIQLIPSENYPSAAILEANGSVMTQKYAEGYPNRRYYQGCQWVDEVESLARRRARRLFKAGHANVQPHSGASANMAVYFAALQPGDAVMGMDLASGGHLTHGSPVNFSSKLYNFVHYGVDPYTDRIDFHQVARLAREHRPKMIVTGATAYPRVWEYDRFKEIADEVGALHMADIAHVAGLIVGGAHPSPIPYAQYVTSTSHKTLRGPRGGFVLCERELRRDLDRSVFPGIQGGPLEHVIAAKAVMFHEAAQPDFAAYAQAVVQNCTALAETLLSEGLALVSGGTDNHLLLVRFAEEGLTGKEAAAALEEAGLVVNKNAVPFDTRSPFVTSGLRMGSPAATTFGFRADEFRTIGRLIAQVLRNVDDDAVKAAVAAEVQELTSAVAERREREDTWPPLFTPHEVPAPALD